MGIVSHVGDSFLSSVFGFLLEKLNGYLCDQLRDSKEEVRAQIESWKALLPKITAVLQHAEENQVVNQLVKPYLDDLRDLAYDMEDILEEFVIDAKRSKLVAESKGRPNKRQKLTSGVKNLFAFMARPNQEINSMVSHLNVRLQQIEDGMRSLNLIDLVMKTEQKSLKVAAERLPESSLLEDKVWGRDGDKDVILQRLLEDGGSLQQDFVIPIVGMGGLGKTTLARLIYNDEKLNDKFDLKAWVCVGDVFDVPKITRTILEHVTGERCDSDFGLLQEKLKGKLSGRKFLLVLDDVWDKEYGQWDNLKRPFMSGALGSKIIVTTRNKDVGTMMRGDGGVYNLELLQDDACLPLFTRHALGKENFDAHPDLQDVGEKLVERCKRLPLALKTLGGILRGKLCRDEWENILNSEIWSSSEDRSGILPALRLSYNHLPSHLKRCFAYCALFPRDYEFDKKKLILLWMAEGLLQQQSCGRKQKAEEIGHQYFQELFSRSLFQQAGRNESRFVMHDLINDLAVDVAGEIYCNLERIMGNEKLDKARHLSFIQHHCEISKRFTILDKSKHLRTFLPLRELLSYYFDFFKLSNEVLHDFLPTLNRLRVLSLRSYWISKLPDSFENLKHIRYIDLSYTNIKCVPESVGSLLLLQTLLLEGCHDLTQLPTTIGNLIDLHHLDISGTSSLEKMPSGIGNLKNLLTLSKFIVGKASGMMRLSDLKNLLQLRGSLSILDLQNVLDVQDAREANLGKIQGLEELVLVWTTSDNDRDELVLQTKVLTWLKPHSNLKSLEVYGYGGESFPDWLGDPLLFFNLSSMGLSNCKSCTLLPSLGRLPALKKLTIGGMEAIKAVGSEFYGVHDSFQKLEELVFGNMLNWTEWASPARSESGFPCLRTLVIRNCPKLRCSPMSLPSLKKLDIGGCNAELLKSMVNLTALTNLSINNISESTCLSMSLPSLEELHIEDCNAELLKGMVNLTSLTNLRIKRIAESTCLTMSMSLPSLEELHVEDCNAELLKSMVNLTSLTNLRIEKIAELTCLPKSFTQSLTALERLDISLCDDFTCLWEEGAEIEESLLPFNLKHLKLEECGALESLPDAMMVQMDGSSGMLMLRLEMLEISGCHSLKSFPRGKLPVTLKYLRIENCQGLESLPDADGNNNSNLHLEITNLPNSLYSSQSQGCHQLLASLKKFGVYGNEWMESFPERMLQNCMGLQSFEIVHFEKLKRLPSLDYVSNLVELRIWGCEALESLPEWGLCTRNLKRLQMYGCGNLKSLPNTMYQLKSLQQLQIYECGNLKSLPNTMYQLKSLQSLSIYRCGNLEFIPDGGLPPNLTSLSLSDCENLKSLPNTMKQLTSLQSLQIQGEALRMGFGGDFQHLTSLKYLIIYQTLPLDIVSPSSLTSISIYNEENLKSIPRGLFQNLNSLEWFQISNCPKLRSLPMEAFPRLVGALHIERCPHLKRERFEAKGDYRTLTRSISSVFIDDRKIEW